MFAQLTRGKNAFNVIYYKDNREKKCNKKKLRRRKMQENKTKKVRWCNVSLRDSPPSANCIIRIYILSCRFDS